MTDVLVIGAGPAGLVAALAAGRAGADQDADQAAHEAADQNHPADDFVLHHRERNFGGQPQRVGGADHDQADDGAGEQALEAYARQHAPSMRHDGWRRVLAGVTTVEEVLRVSKEG